MTEVLEKPARGKSKVQYPDFNPIDYNGSLLKNLQFYNLEQADSKLKKVWALKYWEGQGKQTKEISKLNDSLFITVGAVAHMVSERGIRLDATHISYLNTKYDELVGFTRESNDEESDTIVVKTKEEKRDDVSSSFIADIEYMIDEASLSIRFKEDGKLPDVKGYLIRNNVRPGIAKKIAEWFSSHIKELRDAYDEKDEQLVESFSYFTRRQLKKYIGFYQTIIDSCDSATKIQREARKPRTKKVIPPSQLVKYVKWKESDDVTKLKSEHPAKIIDSYEVWLYNTAIRRLFKCVALPGTKLTIQGTTIKNIDQEKSGGKIIRKPETQLIDVQTGGRININKIYEDIRGTESVSTGRMNDDTILVKCFQ